MLKRNLVLGSLVAGAFLLPSVASAAVTGACVNCHTMHNSQNGAAVVGTTTAGQPTLLNSDCAGCHSGADNSAVTGREAGGEFAPQVANATGAITNILSGGYFVYGGSATNNNQHNVADLANPSDLSNTPPGNTTAMGAQLTCSNCHTGSGGHHATSASYRLLAFGATPVTGTPTANYGVQATIGDRSANAYTVSMNGFCGSCHTDFHTNANQETSAGSYTWIRHPTDLSMAAAAGAAAGMADSIVSGYDATNDTDYAPVGAGAANDMVLCLSCHLPHGGAYGDLLAFNYGGSGSYAGDGDASNGCETCHSYAAAGM